MTTMKIIFATVTDIFETIVEDIMDMIPDPDLLK